MLQSSPSDTNNSGQQYIYVAIAKPAAFRSMTEEEYAQASMKLQTYATGELHQGELAMAERERLVSMKPSTGDARDDRGTHPAAEQDSPNQTDPEEEDGLNADDGPIGAIRINNAVISAIGPHAAVNAGTDHIDVSVAAGLVLSHRTLAAQATSCQRCSTGNARSTIPCRRPWCSDRAGRLNPCNR